MGALIRSMDWSKTGIGPKDSWPQSLLTTASLCLSSNFPMNIVWGLEHVQIYNDAYRVVIGNAHPRALGENYRITWASAWPAIGDSFERALRGEAVFTENQRMFLNRLGPNRALEETYFTFSHSPIRDESGQVGGLFHPVTETTATMLAQRRTRTLRDLAAAHNLASDQDSLAHRTAESLSTNDFDLPFVLIYRFNDKAEAYELTAHFGLEPLGDIAPARLAADSTQPWPLAPAIAAMAPTEVQSLERRLRGLRCGPYEEPPQRAFVIPVATSGASTPQLVLIAGASSRLPMDEAYRGFYQLLAISMSNGLASVRAREDERQRAEALAEIDRAKTTFFSNVSHEFRTPLTLMLGPLEALLNGTALADPERETVTIVHRNGLRLLRLVNSLLDFSRVEAGRIQAVFEAADLATETAELASSFRSACEHAGLELHVEAPPLPEPVYIDREMWEKIVLNLVSNAFKFTLSGSITVRVEADGAAARVSVIDTGTGIAEKELPRIFDRFHRIENSMGRTHEGSGIGLALVQELVNLHGGSVEVISELGKGSTFSVFVPFGKDHLPADRIDAERELTSTSTGARAYVEEAQRWLSDATLPVKSSPQELPEPVATGSHGRVLFADDNADMRDYVRGLLSPRWEVVLAEDGLSALSVARRERPDLIVSDIMMPGLDGFGLVNEIRADPELCELPVILLSARAGEASKVEGLQAGADDYLVKPFTARELIARIETHLKLHLLRRSSAAAVRESEARFRLMADHAPVMIWMSDAQGRCTYISRTWSVFSGQPADIALDDGWLEFLHPEDRERTQQTLRTAIERQSEYSLDYRMRAADGEYRWTVDTALPRFDESGRFVGHVGSIMDISERKKAEQHAEYLLREINHRAKNLLSLVQAVARQTTAQSGPQFLERFSERLQALATSQDLLVDSHWRGACLDELVTSQLSHFGDIVGTRIRCAGPDVTVNPRTAQLIGMALHELGTNAGKYGALSNDRGTVDVHWDVAQVDGEGRLSISWREEGGPPVAMPVHQGFGSFTIDRMLRTALQADIETEFASSGFSWSMSCSISEVLSDAAEPVSRGESAASKPDGLRILIVEDDAFIGAEVGGVLQEQGAEVVGPVGTVRQALAILDRTAVDFAVLDINLGNETSEAVAHRLGETGVPFCVITGYADHQRPAVFAAAPCLSKPLRHEQLRAVVDDVRAARASDEAR